MLELFWPWVNFLTISLYSLIVIFLPINPTYSTLFLFALIALWSRLPGVGIVSPLSIIYLADLVDFFSLLIAINMGPFHGAIFSVFCNICSRMAGIYPRWTGVIWDTIAQFLVCLIIPAIYFSTGNNLVLAMLVYTIIRIVIIFIFNFFEAYRPLPVQIARTIGLLVLSLLINGFYTDLFGDYFNSIVQKGVSFNWPLFILVTVAIIFLRRGRKESKTDPILKRIIERLTPKRKKKMIMIDDFENARRIKDIL